MRKGIDVERVRIAVRNSRIEWQRHALERMAEREIRRSDALGILISGKLIEEYPDDEPFPSGLFLGWIGERPIHVVAAFDEETDRVYVITVYEPDLEHFGPDFRSRRKS